MNYRQKLLKMADASDTGWKVVMEYKTNPLASDSEDEKRMNRAETRAAKKIKQEQTKTARKSSRFSL